MYWSCACIARTATKDFTPFGSNRVSCKRQTLRIAERSRSITRCPIPQNRSNESRFHPTPLFDPSQQFLPLCGIGPIGSATPCDSAHSSSITNDFHWTTSRRPARFCPPERPHGRMDGLRHLICDRKIKWMVLSRIVGLLPCKRLQIGSTFPSAYLKEYAPRRPCSRC